jgi:hypothetical protein
MSPTARPDPAARLAAHAEQVHRHAVWTERLAASVLAAGTTVTVAAALTDPLGSIVPATLSLLGVATAWVLLRALALVLHLRSDEATLVAEGEAAHLA